MAGESVDTRILGLITVGNNCLRIKSEGWEQTWDSNWTNCADAIYHLLSTKGSAALPPHLMGADDNSQEIIRHIEWSHEFDAAGSPADIVEVLRSAPSPGSQVADALEEILNVPEPKWETH